MGSSCGGGQMLVTEPAVPDFALRIKLKCRKRFKPRWVPVIITNDIAVKVGEFGLAERAGCKLAERAESQVEPAWELTKCIPEHLPCGLGVGE